MGIIFPEDSVTVTTASGDTVILRICHICGAAVVDGGTTDLAFHKRWHRASGSENWLDAPTGRFIGRENPFTPGRPPE